MKPGKQLLVVVGLTIAILTIGTRECSHLGAEPQIVETARAANAGAAVHAGSGAVGGGDSLFSLFDEAAPDGRQVLEELLALVGGDTSLLFADSAELDAALLNEQYGEWGAGYRDLTRHPAVQELLRRLADGPEDR
ncbi:hypothetical protein FJY71_10320 [candidate division WOR-3 bacterium]|nr:hypothetical protein [candidate division WOR-3 bacterium]